MSNSISYLIMVMNSWLQKLLGHPKEMKKKKELCFTMTTLSLVRKREDEFFLVPIPVRPNKGFLG